MNSHEWVGSASTVEAAVEKGLKKMGLSRDQVEVKVLGEKTSGLFSLFGFRRMEVKLVEKPGARRDERRGGDRFDRGGRGGRGESRDRGGRGGSRDERPRSEERPRDGRGDRPRDDRPRGDSSRDQRPRNDFNGRRDERGPRDGRDARGGDRDRGSRDRDVRRDERPAPRSEDRPRDDRPRDERGDRPRGDAPGDQRPRSDFGGHRDERGPRGDAGRGPRRDERPAQGDRPREESAPRATGPVPSPETLLSQWKALLGWDDLSWTVKNGESGEITLVFRKMRPEILESFQHLLNSVRSKSDRGAPRVFLEVEGQANDEKNLADEANRAAEEVKRTGLPFQLEPMDSRSRRLVHQALAGHPDVETTSEGEGQWRKVVVKPKSRN